MNNGSISQIKGSDGTYDLIDLNARHEIANVTSQLIQLNDQFNDLENKTLVNLKSEIIARLKEVEENPRAPTSISESLNGIGKFWIENYTIENR